MIQLLNVNSSACKSLLMTMKLKFYCFPTNFRFSKTSRNRNNWTVYFQLTFVTTKLRKKYYHWEHQNHQQIVKITFLCIQALKCLIVAKTLHWQWTKNKIDRFVVANKHVLLIFAWYQLDIQINRINSNSRQKFCN